MFLLLYKYLLVNICIFASWVIVLGMLWPLLLNPCFRLAQVCWFNTALKKKNFACFWFFRTTQCIEDNGLGFSTNELWGSSVPIPTCRFCPLWVRWWRSPDRPGWGRAPPAAALMCSPPWSSSSREELWAVAPEARLDRRLSCGPCRGRWPSRRWGWPRGRRLAGYGCWRSVWWASVPPRCHGCLVGMKEPNLNRKQKDWYTTVLTAERLLPFSGVEPEEKKLEIIPSYDFLASRKAVDKVCIFS